MREKQAGQHSQRLRTGAKVDAKTLMAQFPPETLRSLSRLEAAVCDSDHFDRDILENLQGVAAGNHLSVPDALTNVGFIVREAMKHIHATSDEKAEKALNDFIGDLFEHSDKVTVMKRSGHRR
jgi:hypothetical protein